MGRSDEIPEVVCAHTLEQPPPPDDEEEEPVSKLPPVAGTSSMDLPHHQRPPTEDLRRSLVKARLAATESAAASAAKGAAATAAACGRPLAKSDSMDSMLGESLLDPPPSMSRMAPRRYQSPSRCGSPSLEAPDHLLLGSRVASGGAAAAGAAAAPARPPPPTYEQAIFSMNAFGSGCVSGRGEGNSAGEGGADEGFRLNRHDLLRRRDLNLFHGLHPRLLHGQPRLSLPPKLPQPPSSSPLLPCRARFSGGALPNRPPGSAAAASGEQPPPLPLTDRLPNHCTLSGKHICQYEEELEETSVTTSTAAATATAADRQQLPPPAAVTSSPPLPCQPPSSSSSSSSSSSLASSPPSGDNYQQGELGGAKAHRRRGNWPGRALRTATPYTRDWSAEDVSSSCSGGLSESQRLCKAGKGGVEGRGLSQAEMEEVLELLKARASPSIAAAAGRRPSLKDEQDAAKSRRSSLDEIFDPVGNGIR